MPRVLQIISDELQENFDNWFTKTFIHDDGGFVPKVLCGRLHRAWGKLNGKIYVKRGNFNLLMAEHATHAIMGGQAVWLGISLKNPNIVNEMFTELKKFNTRRNVLITPDLAVTTATRQIFDKE